jgi:AraC-like DNA-binding protein
MLTYVSSGTRAFGERPIAPYRRESWEFYAILRGRAAPLFEDAHVLSPLMRDTIWVFPPGHAHGWRGELGRSAGVAVFHFLRVPAALEAKVNEQGGVLAVSLSRKARRRVTMLAHELQPLLWERGALRDLQAERVAIELSLLILESGRRRENQGGAHALEDRVSLAERWFAEHLEERPSLEQIACRLGVSPGQMRRLFVMVRGASSKAVLERIRLTRAEALLAGSDLKLSAVAAMSGYASASAFAQAFRKTHGVTPDTWRRGLAGG